VTQYLNRPAPLLSITPAGPEDLVGVGRATLLGTGERGAAGAMRWLALLAVVGLTAVAQFQEFGAALVAPQLSSTLGITPGTVAALTLLEDLVVVLGALGLATVVVHQARRAAVARWVAAAGCALMIGSAFVLDAFGLLGLLAGAGIVVAAVQTLHLPLLSDLAVPRRRLRVLAVQRAGALGGLAVLVGILGLTLGLLGLTWRASFLALALLTTLAVALAWPLSDAGAGVYDEQPLRRQVRRRSGDATDLVDGAGPDLGLAEIMRRLLLVPTVRTLMGTFAVLGTLSAPLYAYLGFLLQGRWHMAAGARLTVLGVCGAVGVGAVLIGAGRLESLVEGGLRAVTRAVVVLFVVAAVSLVVMALSPWLVLAGVCLVVVMAAAGLALAAANGVLMSVVEPRMRPQAGALSAMAMWAVGGVGGVLVLTSVSQHFGTAPAIGVLAVPLLAGARLLNQRADSADRDLDQLVTQVVEDEQLRHRRRRGEHVPMLSCRHIDFSYGLLQVLFDVDFTVDEGERVALLGTNGAGKSTLLRVISGLGLPERGSVHFEGGDITYLDAERRVGLGITQIPGGRAVFGPMSVVENLRVYGHSLGHDRRTLDRGIEATFDAFPRLADRRNQLAATLSGGEQQMLGLGKAFLLHPKILLIDELSLGLAPKVVGELLAMVRRINDGGTAIVLVEQSVNIALTTVEHAYFMEKGEIRFDGRAEELLRRDDLLRSVFLEGAGKAMGA
jgi:ABC-type branched-subunit amino acid transport system ATPase component